MLRIERPEPPACATRDVVAAWTDQFVRSGRMRWDHVCQQQLRTAVLALCHGRCAFCDGKLGVESRETVEHFRPKHAKGWPELAYAWTNLFPACDVCQSAKRDQWDEALLKPDAADYTFDRYFCCNFLTGALDVLPEPLNGEVERALTTLRIFDLNRPARCNSRLREYRAWQRARRDGAGQAELDDYNYRFFLRES